MEYYYRVNGHSRRPLTVELVSARGQREMQPRETDYRLLP